jgi:glycerophosphoryl diester phosphodiesterase
LYLLQNHLPNVPRALLVSPEKVQDNAWYLREMALAPLLKLHMLNLEQSMVTGPALSFWQEKKMPISVWTVNEAEKIHEFLDMGVASVITDSWPVP